jgi:hypothetical protein
MRPTPQPVGRDERCAMLARAERTDGFFDREEANFLMDAVASVSKGTAILEVSSYKGRSTLFLLAAIQPGQRLFSVDSFRTAASCKGPFLFIPRLQAITFDVVFIDGDHSFMGVSQDLALGVELSCAGAIPLCHDVTGLFPDVWAAT